VCTTSVRDASTTPADPPAPPRAERSAPARDAASAKRAAGSLANADRNTGSNAGGSASDGSSIGGGASTCIIKVSTGVAPRNGTRPVKASNTTMPSEYRSLRKSARRPRACSGLMYSGLPRT
jgi:hypothetical protein